MEINNEIKPHLTMMSWKAIFAGFFISVLTAMTLLSLGVGLGGIALSDLEGIAEFGWGAAIWTALTVVVSLFVGSYVASRVSNFLSRSVGMAQGATIAAMFFVLAIWGGGLFVGAMGNALVNVTKGVASMPTADLASTIYQNEEFREAINTELRDLGIPPQNVDNVIAGIVPRLLMGDIQGAERVVATYTNIDPQVISQRVEVLQNAAVQQATNAVQETAEAFSAAGWSTFFLLVLGGASAILGGIAASKANVKHSLEQDEILRVA